MQARQPLLPSRNAARRPGFMAFVPAALAACAALLLLAVSLTAFNAESQPDERLQEHPPTLYYVPVKTSRPWKKQQQLVYYYLPQSSHGLSMLNGSAAAGNSSAGGQNSSSARGGSNDFVCSVANIKALHAAVQPKWDACKSNPNYKEPNKGAKRRWAMPGRVGR